MKWLRRILLSLATLGIVALALAGHYYYKAFYRPSHTHRKSAASGHPGLAEAERITERAAALRKFLVSRTGAAGGYNTRLAFLLDMRLPSGKNRFFVYDLTGDSILMSGLVAHGSGGASFSLSPAFSNVEGSNCSALGRYRVGSPYTGQWSRCYFLYGLDTTNNRALQRHIVLHSYGCVPEDETDPYPICNSKGCTMVSPGFLARLQPVIDTAKKPIILWIFN